MESQTLHFPFSFLFYNFVSFSNLLIMHKHLLAQFPYTLSSIIIGYNYLSFNFLVEVVSCLILNFFRINETSLCLKKQLLKQFIVTLLVNTKLVAYDIMLNQLMLLHFRTNGYLIVRNSFKLARHNHQVNFHNYGQVTDPFPCH